MSALSAVRAVRDVWAVLALAAGFALSAALAWPGFMSQDSLAQFEAARAGVYDDWHPPLMAWWWRQLLAFADGPQPMLVLHLGLLWGGLALLWHAWRDRWPAALLPLVGLLPWVLNFSGVIWKDTGMACALVAAAGLLARPPGPVRAALVLPVLFYALSLRHNAVFAVLPLLWWWLHGLRPRWPAWRHVLGAALAAGVMLAAGPLLQSQLLDAAPRRPQNFVLADDLAFLSLVERRSLIPGVEMAQIMTCAGREIGTSKYTGKYACLDHLANRAPGNPVQRELGPAWRDAVKRQPVAWLRYRVASFAYLLRTGAAAPFYIHHAGIDGNAHGLALRHPALAAAALRTFEASAAALPWLFKPIGWLCIATGLLAASLAVSAGRAVVPARVLLVSAIGYTLGYLPVTPMADFRYVYWSVVATNVAAVLLLIGLRRPERGALRGLRGTVALIVAAVAMVAASRLDRLVDLDPDALMFAQLPPPRALPAPGAELRYVSFRVVCDGGARRQPTVRVRWWGDGQPGPSADAQAEFDAHFGVNVIALAAYPPGPAQRMIDGVRIDVLTPDACRTLTVRDIALH